MTDVVFVGLIAAVVSVITAGATTAAVLVRLVWWAGARVERVDSTLNNHEDRIDAIEKKMEHS